VWLLHRLRKGMPQDSTRDLAPAFTQHLQLARSLRDDDLTHRLVLSVMRCVRKGSVGGVRPLSRWRVWPAVVPLVLSFWAQEGAAAYAATKPSPSLGHLWKWLSGSDGPGLSSKTGSAHDVRAAQAGPGHPSGKAPPGDSGLHRHVVGHGLRHGVRQHLGVHRDRPVADHRPGHRLVPEGRPRPDRQLRPVRVLLGDQLAPVEEVRLLPGRRARALHHRHVQQELRAGHRTHLPQGELHLPIPSSAAPGEGDRPGLLAHLAPEVRLRGLLLLGHADRHLRLADLHQVDGPVRGLELVEVVLLDGRGLRRLVDDHEQQPTPLHAGGSTTDRLPTRAERRSRL
jgi:hypothetical protein